MADTQSMTRRRFLGRIAAAGAAPVFAPTVVPCSALGAEGKVAPSNRVTVGMIGLGRQAIAHNLPVFARAADAQVVALCDVDRWRLNFCKENPAAVGVAKQRKIDINKMERCFRTTDFREVLARKDVDAVVYQRCEVFSQKEHEHDKKMPIRLFNQHRRIPNRSLGLGCRDCRRQSVAHIRQADQPVELGASQRGIDRNRQSRRMVVGLLRESRYQDTERGSDGR